MGERINASTDVLGLGLDDIATGEVCDVHPSARAEFRSVTYGLTFCGHCALYGVGRELALEPIGGDADMP